MTPYTSSLSVFPHARILSMDDNHHASYPNNPSETAANAMFQPLFSRTLKPLKPMRHAGRHVLPPPIARFRERTSAMKSLLGPFLWMTVLWLLSLVPAFAAPSDPATRQVVQQLKDEWAEVFYRLPTKQQAPKLEVFLSRSRDLVRRYPRAAEPLLMQALVLCSLAAADGGFGALGRVKEARELVVKAIALDPMAMEGSGYVILGNLYYRLPGWPISFGNDKLARVNLETALRLFPDEMDTNYFYGDFLLEEGEFKAALPYLEKAEKSPVRDDSRLSDLRLKEELKQALKDARERNTKRSNFFSQFLAIFNKEPRN